MSDFVPRIRIPLFEAQLENVTTAIRDGGYLSQGPHLEQLSASLCSMFDMQYAVLTSNGFAALFAILKSYSSGENAVLTAPASTCFAFVNAIKAAGCKPTFVDMDVASASITEDVEPPLWGGDNAIAVVPDHFGRIAPFCRKPRSDKGLLIEDAAQSFLSRRNVSTESDVLVLSFYPTKLVNGIDGGAVLTNRQDIYEGVKHMVSYVDQFKYESTTRFNLGMNNINAAFALGTLTHIEEIQSALLQKFAALQKICEQSGLRVLMPETGEVPSRFIVMTDNTEERDVLQDRFRHAKIEASRELMRLCSQTDRDRFPNADKLVELSFSLPFHPSLSVSGLESIRTVLEN